MNITKTTEWSITVANCQSWLWMLVVALVLTANGGRGAEFFTIGDFPGGEFRSLAVRVSPDGQKVYGRSKSGDDLRVFNLAFEWTKENGLNSFDQSSIRTQPGTFLGSSAHAASSEGKIVVGSFGIRSEGGSLIRNEPFVWDAEEGFLDLSGMTDGGLTPEVNSDVTPDGDIVVGHGRRHVPGKPHPQSQAFRWTREDGFRALDNLLDPESGSSQSFSASVSANGKVSVGYALWDDDSPIRREAVRWNASGQATGLGDLPGERDWSLAWDVSADGTIIVGEAWGERGREPFYWTEATGMIGLGDQPGGIIHGIARAISSDGSIIVGRGSGDRDDSAMIWDPIRGGRSLRQVLEDEFGLGEELAGWDLDNAVDISADGKTIAGNGVNPQGNREGWVVVLDELPDIPELRPGDIDLDGVVSLSDFTILKEHFGIGGFRYQGDLDGDFDVDLEDFNLVKSHFGEGAAQVPEPSSLVLLLSGLFFFPLLLRPRRG